MTSHPTTPLLPLPKKLLTLLILPKQLHTPPTLTKTATHPTYPYLNAGVAPGGQTSVVSIAPVVGVDGGGGDAGACLWGVGHTARIRRRQ